MRLLAADSFTPAELAAVLEEGRYVVGGERNFYGNSPCKKQQPTYLAAGPEVNRDTLAYELDERIPP